MPIFNYKSKELIVKIVYYGPGLCGKTTSLQQLHQQTIPDRKGELYYLATETDQTIYFELLPLYVGEIKDFKLRFQVYTVPGQVKYNHTRKIVLQGVDAVIFVADSQRSRRKANLMSLENLRYNLQGGYNVRLEDVPLVYAYNKRDMWDILSVEEMNQDLNPRDLPYFEAIATEGKGVLESFEKISSLAIENLEKRFDQIEVSRPPATSKKEPQARMQPVKLSDHNLADIEAETLPLEEGEAEGERNFQIEHLDISEARLISESDDLIAREGKNKNLSYVDIIAETYHNGDIIFEEGEPGDKMYFIELGKVKIIGSYKGARKVLITYEKGDFFGEMALFGGTTRSARAVAIGTTHLLPVKKETLASQIKDRPEIAMAILKTLSTRIRNNTATINKLADQNKDLILRLKKAQGMMQQLMEQNKALKQELETAKQSPK